ncbi:MAG: alpha/beta hydrolase [Treponema sp.]|nr:alpha/beta hydrolase [Treponema sp.]
MAEFNFQGKKVYYETYGAGEPILLLNGIMMATKGWAPFIENFSQNNQLILVDFFDQGQSERMTEPYDFSIQTALLGGLLDTLKLDSVNVCGISYGAKVGVDFAVNNPKRVRRLLSFNGAARMPPLLAEISKSWNEAAKLEGGMAYYLATIPVIYSDIFYERQRAWMDKRQELLVPYFGFPGVKEPLVRLTNSMMTFDVVDKLSALDMPVLVVTGKNDNLIPQREQEIMVNSIKNAQHVILPECGHASMFEKPMLFSSLILGFVNSKNSEFAV